MQEVGYQHVVCHLTPVSQMEVGCSRIWGLKPTTQTQVGGTPHKPARLATQPWALPATPDSKSSTHHTEQWVEWKKTIEERPLLPWIGRGGRGNTRKHTTPPHRTLSWEKATRTCAGTWLYAEESLTARTARRHPEKAPHGLIHAHATNAAGTPPNTNKP